MRSWTCSSSLSTCHGEWEDWVEDGDIETWQSWWFMVAMDRWPIQLQRGPIRLFDLLLVIKSYCNSHLHPLLALTILRSSLARLIVPCIQKKATTTNALGKPIHPLARSNYLPITAQSHLSSPPTNSSTTTAIVMCLFSPIDDCIQFALSRKMRRRIHCV